MTASATQSGLPNPWRKTTQHLMPSRRTEIMEGRYDIYPSFSLGAGHIEGGFEALAQRLAHAGQVIIDGFPGVLWEKLSAQTAAGADPRTALDDETVAAALAVAGLDFTPEQRAAIRSGLQQNLDRYVERRSFAIDPDVAPPLHFTPLVPGATVDRAERPFRPSRLDRLTRPATLEALAFWPVRHLAELLRTRQVTSQAITEMYLARLQRHGDTLRCTITLTKDLALQQAREADREIAAGRYRGPLHGVPCLDEIGGHRVSHVPEADECDCRHVIVSRSSSAR